jgi:hypothetical protein
MLHFPHFPQIPHFPHFQTRKNANKTALFHTSHTLFFLLLSSQPAFAAPPVSPRAHLSRRLAVTSVTSAT